MKAAITRKAYKFREHSHCLLLLHSHYSVICSFYYILCRAENNTKRTEISLIIPIIRTTAPDNPLTAPFFLTGIPENAVTLLDAFDGDKSPACLGRLGVNAFRFCVKPDSLVFDSDFLALFSPGVFLAGQVTVLFSGAVYAFSAERFMFLFGVLALSAALLIFFSIRIRYE